MLSKNQDPIQSDTLIKSGKEVLPFLAQTYQQLYLKPGEEGAKLYPEIVLKGKDAPEKDLSHFQMHEEDRLELTDTPAGEVQVVTLHAREDFEQFLYIMANKCVPYDVPLTQGASILDGVVNWRRILKHRENWMKEMRDKGVIFPDWTGEFRRFTSDRANYRDALIILSTGPYSNIQASSLGMEEAKWLDLSYIIRKYHECTHFICRRRFPEQINAVWDEIVADAVGIIAAFGRFDPVLEEIFFGISAREYTGGRLENYVEEKSGLNDLAAGIHDVIGRIQKLYEELCTQDPVIRPFDFALRLEEKQAEWWP